VSHLVSISVRTFPVVSEYFILPEGGLFGREGSPSKTATDVRKYNVLDLSPDGPDIPDGQSVGKLRKSMSLDSRNSYKAAIRDNDVKSADSQPIDSHRLLAKRGSIESKVSCLSSFFWRADFANFGEVSSFSSSFSVSFG